MMVPFRIVRPQFFWKNVRYAILVVAVVAAIVTPTPDATTMLIFMAPLVALYFLGIVVAALISKGGSGPSGGPQHPLPVASVLETSKPKRAS